MNINFEKYVQQLIDWVVQSGWKVILILVLMVIGIKISGVSAGRLFPKRKRESDAEYRKRAETLTAVVSYLFSVTIVIIGAIMILGEFDIKVGPILAAACGTPKATEATETPQRQKENTNRQPRSHRRRSLGCLGIEILL